MDGRRLNRSGATSDRRQLGRLAGWLFEAPNRAQQISGGRMEGVKLVTWQVLRRQ